MTCGERSIQTRNVVVGEQDVATGFLADAVRAGVAKDRGLAQAGEDARIGWMESQNSVDLTRQYSYYSVSYYPGKLFHDTMLNSDVTPPSGELNQGLYPGN